MHMKKKSLGCDISKSITYLYLKNDEGRTTEERLPNGLYQGHAYSITALTEVSTELILVL